MTKVSVNCKILNIYHSYCSEIAVTISCPDLNTALHKAISVKNVYTKLMQWYRLAQRIKLLSFIAFQM